MKATVIPVKHKIIGGKKWLYDPISLNLQCAYCCFNQYLPILREDGLIVGLTLEEESHAPECPQHEANYKHE
jgi:hypothetical protein